jgi:hypothetical protein
MGEKGGDCYSASKTFENTPILLTLVASSLFYILGLTS